MPHIDGEYRIHDENPFTLEYWLAILSFLTGFIRDDIRVRAIREIETFQSCVDPIERIALAIRHNHLQRLSGAYQELCQYRGSFFEEGGLD